MPINMTGNTYRRAPAGYYFCRFVGADQVTVTGFEGDPIEKTVWHFVGYPWPDGDESDTYELTVWTTNSFGRNSNQRKLVARMGGTTTRDAVGALLAVPCNPDPLRDPRLRELGDTNFAAWEGERFLLRQEEGTNRLGDPITFCNVDSVWRAEGEPPLLPDNVLGTHPSGRPADAKVEGAVAAQGPIKKGLKNAPESPDNASGVAQVSEDPFVTEA